jgi:hypothetical protein
MFRRLLKGGDVGERSVGETEGDRDVEGWTTLRLSRTNGCQSDFENRLDAHRSQRAK